MSSDRWYPIFGGAFQNKPRSAQVAETTGRSYSDSRDRLRHTLHGEIHYDYIPHEIRNYCAFNQTPQSSIVAARRNLALNLEKYFDPELVIDTTGRPDLRTIRSGAGRKRNCNRYRSQAPAHERRDISVDDYEMDSEDYEMTSEDYDMAFDDAVRRQLRR